MTAQPGFHNRGHYIALKIRSLLTSLTRAPAEYDEIVPKIEYWIEYVLREQFTTIDELVEGVSCVAWDQGGSHPSVARFLKEFHDAPHRSGQARSFVDKLCEHVLRWFAIASVEDMSWHSSFVAKCGGSGFVRVASFIGQLIERGMLGHGLVQRHLVKPLIAHHHADPDYTKAIRASAIYQLFITAGNTLLRGLLESGDVQVCFDVLNVCVPFGWVSGLTGGKLQEFREIHAAWLVQREGNQSGAGEAGVGEGEGTEGMVVAEVTAEIETPIAFVSRDLPAVETGTDIRPSTSQGGVWPSYGSFVDITATAVSSPTLSISTVSDLTPTELGEETEYIGEQTTTRHDTFYFKDGNVEIVCGDTVFRVHSTIITLSSPKLREMLSPTTLLNAPTPEGCPRISFADSAEDFAVLLKMICTPGFPARHEVPKFSVFASLLRMTARYGLSDIRDQLIKDLEGAYPTEWEKYQTAEVLGEDVFGLPKPHPNAVLNLFMAQGIRFALRFAAYRASLGGFRALVSDEPGTELPRLTLASTVHGMEMIRSLMTCAADALAYERKLLFVCPNRTCVLNVGTDPMEKRMEAVKKLHSAMLCKRDAEVLSAPSFRDLACVRCAKDMEAYHTAWRMICWETLRTFCDESEVQG